jgi:succinate dehydrogenase/fumarate reductase cytochrome b subunit
MLVVAPWLFGFGGAPAVVCYVLAALQVGMSLITAYPLSVAKLIPFTVHGAVELITAIFLVIAPWLFGFHGVDGARNFFIAAGIGLGLVYLMTNYQAARRFEGYSRERVPTH